MRQRLAAVIAFVVCVGIVGAAEAQVVPATARIVRVVGPVEVRLGGASSPWSPARVGAQLAEYDEMRALAGGSAELSLPDGSTLIVAENTRFVVSRLRVDPQNQGRSAIFHLATGKLRAIVNQASVRLVQLRQSTFAISTPAAVASVRGTDMVVMYSNPMNMAVRGGHACCIAVASGIGIPVPDGTTSNADTGAFICILPRSMTQQEEQIFYATLNPGGNLHPMMNLPVTIIDPTLIEELWGCDPPFARRGEEPPKSDESKNRPEGFPDPISPTSLRPRIR
jgi:hypothetical protein